MATTQLRAPRSNSAAATRVSRPTPSLLPHVASWWQRGEGRCRQPSALLTRPLSHWPEALVRRRRWRRRWRRRRRIPRQCANVRAPGPGPRRRRRRCTPGRCPTRDQRLRRRARGPLWGSLKWAGRRRATDGVGGSDGCTARPGGGRWSRRPLQARGGGANCLPRGHERRLMSSG